MTQSVLTKSDRTAIIVATGAFLLFATLGIRQSFGLFLTPYTTELGIGRDTFSFAIAMQNLLWGFASPFFGGLADRRGPVLAVSLGGIFYTIGLLIMAAAQGSALLLIAQSFVGIGLAGAGFSVVLGTVGKSVRPEKRAISLALVSATGSLGQFILIPIAQIGLEAFNMRGAMVMFACLSVLMIAVAPLIRLPKVSDSATPHQNLKTVSTVAFSSRSFILIFLGFFVCGFQVVFVATHLPAYVNDNNLPSSVAVTALAMVGLFNILGTLFCGWIGDKMQKKNALSLFYLARSLVILIFILVPISPTSVIVFGCAIGFLWLGTVPLTSSLVAVLFGTRHMSMLYGYVFLSHQVGSFLGAWMGGLLFEQLGSYDIVWFISILLGIGAAAIHYPVDERLDSNYARQFA